MKKRFPRHPHAASCLIAATAQSVEPRPLMRQSAFLPPAVSPELWTGCSRSNSALTAGSGPCCPHRPSLLTGQPVQPASPSSVPSGYSATRSGSHRPCPVLKSSLVPGSAPRLCPHYNSRLVPSYPLGVSFAAVWMLILHNYLCVC